MTHPLLQEASDRLTEAEETIETIRLLKLKQRVWCNGDFLLPESAKYTIIYEGQISDDDGKTFDRDKVQRAVLDDITRPYVINIESPPMDIRKHKEQTVTENIRKVVEVFEWARMANPAGDYGIYDRTMLRDYKSPLIGSATRIVGWRKANNFLKPLADVSDSIYPSLYTFAQHSPRERLINATANLDEAFRVSQGKPVRPFIWPRYHQSDARRGLNGISWHVWSNLLDFIASKPIDAICVWDAESFVRNNGAEAWTDESEWRIATREWVRTSP